MKKSFIALAMSWGSVYVLPSYVSVVGDVRSCALEGSTDFRTFACCFGSSLVFRSSSIRCFLLAIVITRFSLFLYVVCALMLAGVGFVILRSCSWCCRLSSLYVGVHRCLLRGLGLFSCFSMVVCIVR